MHSHSIEQWQHSHVYLGEKHDAHERRTWFVVALASTMMVAEISGGHFFGSMALIADGWHMSTHAGALSIAAFAYRFARRHAEDPSFSFGTGKVGELAGFSSAVVLALVALLIAYESIGRLISPIAIQFDQAILIAALGLAVNLVTAWMLYDEDHHHHHHGADADDVDHDHDHHHEHDHDHEEEHHPDTRDYNIRAAYFHVLADAMTSVFAISALLAGRFYGWVFLDPTMGIVGAIVITYWSIGLMRATGAVLLDIVPNRSLAARVRRQLELGGDRVADIHLWRLGPGHAALIAAVVSDHPEPPAAYKARLGGIAGLSHVTIEVHACEHRPQTAAA
jgi:cation diffusion facilitator family transporter